MIIILFYFTTNNFVIVKNNIITDKPKYYRLHIVRNNLTKYLDIIYISFAGVQSANLYRVKTELNAIRILFAEPKD